MQRHDVALTTYQCRVNENDIVAIRCGWIPMGGVNGDLPEVACAVLEEHIHVQANQCCQIAGLIS